MTVGDSYGRQLEDNRRQLEAIYIYRTVGAHKQDINRTSILTLLTMDFICKICGNQYTDRSNLSRHGRTHRQARVECTCGQSFSRGDNLKRHQFMSKTCRALEDAAEETLVAEPSSKPSAIITSKNIDLDKVSDSSQNEESQNDDPHTVVKKLRHSETSRKNSHVATPQNIESSNDSSNADSASGDDNNIKLKRKSSKI